MLVLSRADVEAALDVPALVDAVRDAMVDLSAGRASAPPRVAALVEERDGLLAAMPAHLPSVGALTTKLVSVFPRNTDRPTHQAVICCFDPATGTPTALLDGEAITALRTAAGSSLAITHLARPDSAVVAIVGTGVQARAHLDVLATMGQGERYLVAGRDEAAARALAAAVAERHGVVVEVRGSAARAIAEADIACATTHADAPVVERTVLRPGTHVCSVGYNTAGTGEVDCRTVLDSVLVVESRAAACAPPPAGAVELRGLDLDPAELGEVISGTRPGRTDDAQLTLYKSVGVAVQDAAAAAQVLAAAERLGLGTTVDL